MKNQVKMFKAKLLIFLYYLHISYCDWVAEWMSPVQEQLRQTQAAMASRRLMDEDVVRMVQISQDVPDELPLYSRPRAEDSLSSVKLKNKLEDTVTNAEDLIDKLQLQLAILERKESILKEAIANGRSGVSTVSVNTLSQPPRTYIIREGAWSVCNGMVQYPAAAANTNLFNDLFATPRCIGQETESKLDPCVFNSVIKYETVPERRRLEYTEDFYLCLKPAFNTSLEQFLSVPKDVVTKTCKDGIVRSLDENVKQCGLRIISEYTFYPHKSGSAAQLPLEYCTERDGSCKLIVAWHVSKTSVENFEFLKNETSFKKYFLSTGSNFEQI